jgi:hypothetical protein
MVYRLFPVSVHTRNFTECGIAYIAVTVQSDLRIYCADRAKE